MLCLKGNHEVLLLDFLHIVHGHALVAKPEVRANRINIDTGPFATGCLTCLKLNGSEIGFHLIAAARGPAILA
jgi:hypothetical protein